MTVLVVVQARTGSSRLPGKVMREVAGAPVLQRMLERVLAARSEFELVVATTTEPADGVVAELCAGLRLDCFRGHPTDLLDRHYQAARERGADVVVKIPSDCPLVDPVAVDRVLGAFLAQPGTWDYASNLHPPTWPDGNDVEVVSFRVLEEAWRSALRPFEREHTTPYVWDRPERFRIRNVRWETGLDLSRSHRFVLDYEEDLAFVREVYDALWRPEQPVFEIGAVLGLLARRPDLVELNRRHAGVNWYRHHLDELRTVSAADTRRESGATS
jgi:spore coat polysaccharide biosynthesis protein SpsF